MFSASSRIESLNIGFVVVRAVLTRCRKSPVGLFDDVEVAVQILILSFGGLIGSGSGRLAKNIASGGSCLHGRIDSGWREVIVPTPGDFRSL